MRFLPLAAGIGAALLALASTPTQAAYYRDTNAAAMCHPANGAAVAKFTRTSHYLANNATTDQFVVCDFTMDDSSGAPWAQGTLRIEAWATAPGTITCVAQTGRMVNGAVYATATQTRTYTFEAGNAGTSLNWLDGIARMNNLDVLTLNCKVAPGMKLGVIEHIESQPV